MIMEASYSATEQPTLNIAKNNEFLKLIITPRAGLEPATSSLGGKRSNPN
jgi:hypothetical protein